MNYSLKEINVELGKLLKPKIKKDKTYSKKIAHKIGISNTTFSLKLTGKRHFTPEELCNISKNLNIEFKFNAEGVSINNISEANMDVTESPETMGIEWE